MELRQLEAFAATLTCGSVSGAARLLSRSQPAVSRLIQELEAELGHALFVRQGPRVTPTTQGFLLYEEVEQALGSLRRIRERADEIARDETQPYRLVATDALSVGLLPQALAQVQHEMGAARLTLRSLSAERVVHAVVNGNAQWGVSSLPLEHRGLRIDWIGEAPCVVALREDDPLAREDCVPIAALAQRPLITMLNRYRLRHRLDRAWQLHPRPRHLPLIEANTSMTAQSSVRAGLGVAVLEPASVLGATLPGVVARPIDFPIPFFFGVITPQAQPVRPALHALGDALRATAQALLPGFVCHEPERHADLLRALYGPADTPETASHD